MIAYNLDRVNHFVDDFQYIFLKVLILWTLYDIINSKVVIIMRLVSSFQLRLKEAMNGMKATELGDKIGLSKQAISAYLTGTRSPKRPVINALSDALGVSPMWLMGYDVEKTKKIEPAGLPDEHNEKLNKLMEILEKIPDDKLDVVISMLGPLAK